MDNDVKKTIVDLVQRVNSEETKEDVERVKNVSPLDDLRLAIFEFFKYRMQAIKQADSLKAIVTDEIVDKIQKHEFTPSQLIGLLSKLNSDSTIAVDSLLSLLKPVPNATSPLIPKEQEEDDMDRFENLTPEDSRAIDKLTRIVRLMEKEGVDKQEDSE